VSLARNTAISLLAAAIVLSLAACGREEADLSNGKAEFTQRCGTCHILGRAGTQGRTGPDLDAAFRAALQSGMDRETIEGIVHQQILHPNSKMPAEVVTGEDAKDVAAYVGFAAARTGEDQGALAQAGLAGARTGEQIFTAAGCGACHTLAKANANATIGPSLDELAQSAADQGGSPEDYVRESLVDPDAVTVEGFQGGVMPSYDGRLTDEQLQALVQYLLEGG
jgi:mono/diheme cytochrome c family protein